MQSLTSAPPSTSGQPVRRADPAIELLASAFDALRRAEWATSAGVRYELAYLSALRSGAAVLALRAKPRSLRTRPRGMWGLLAAAAPELAEWAQFFALCGAQGAASQDGRGLVSARQADDLMRDAATFLAIAQGSVAHDGVAPGRAADGPTAPARAAARARR